MLRKVFGPKSDKLTVKWNRMRREEFHDEEFHDLYCTQNITKMIKSKITGRTVHVARVVQRRGAHNSGHLENVCVDKRIILK